MADTHDDPSGAMFHWLLAPLVCQSIGAAARLCVADQFQDVPVSTSALAEAVEANEDALRRIMRVLADAGLFTKEAADAWRITRMGETLKSDVPGSMRHMAILQTDAVHWPILGRLNECVREGKPQAENALGCSPWEYYKDHPEDADSFSHAMANISAMAKEHVLANYDFAGAETIVDVGGAYGALLAAILRQQPKAKGVLFDQPHVLSQAGQVLGDVNSRVTKASGSFFTDELPAGDLYTLKHILHDWNDEDCVTILKAVRRAMNPGAKVLVVEMIVPDEKATGPVIRLDLLMMVVLGGKERTSAEFATLFEQAGLRHTRTILTESPFALVQAEAVE